MVGSVEGRNKRVKEYVSSRLAAAASTSLGQKELAGLVREQEILDRLIPVGVAGFRGVVLTGMAGMHIDSRYSPTKDFYACNPRSIFEKGIYQALVEARVPCGKSDPLNVAKNQSTIDLAWASGRRPESAARAAVEYLTLLESSKGTARYVLLERLFFQRLRDFGVAHAATHVAHTYATDEAPIEFAKRLGRFAVECPEGGTIPQFLVGLLLEVLRTNSNLQVGGVRESVYGTNTTSKKAGDLWETSKDSGALETIYEITVKPVDEKRLDDCVESLVALGLQLLPVTFICRIPNDVEGLVMEGNSLNHGGVNFQFLDIQDFIQTTYCLLTADQRAAYFEQLQTFIGDVNRKSSTRQYWSERFAPRS